VPAVTRAAALAIAVCAGACHDASYLSYAWDDRRVLCSDSVDDLSATAPWRLVEDELALARDARRVALFHAHRPGVTISIAGIEHVLELVERDQLEYFTYRDLVPGPARAGIALAFDDNAIEEWLSIRDLLLAHGARVTFFVSRYARLDDHERAGLDLLARDGHDLQPHSVDHLHGLAYVNEHGLDGYMHDEVLPSLDIMANAGYPPTVYAYPFGEHTAAIDDQLLQRVGRVRTTPGECPW
jgi:hypothetical protein